MSVFSTSFVWESWFWFCLLLLRLSSAASATHHRQDIFSQRVSERVTECLGSQFLSDVLQQLTITIHRFWASLFFKDVEHNMMCVCMCVSFPRCAVMRAWGHWGKNQGTAGWTFGVLVSSYESERISSDFYKNCGRNLIPALGQKYQPQIFKPPSLWATRRTRTALMWRSDPCRTR